MFGLPGAYTPTCSAKHVPGYVEKFDQLKAAGVWVNTSNEEVVRYVGRLLRALDPAVAAPYSGKPVDLGSLQKPLAGINIGLESFAENLAAQEAPVVHVDWRPPAGGNERLMAILERMKQN